MNIFDPHISGSLSVSGSGEISGDLRVLGTINATISGTTSNAISASHAAEYTLTSSFHQFTSSYTTGSFTGSFIGDGSGLMNIPASGVTGLNLTQIADGSVTASVSNSNGLRVNSNTEITGSLTVTGDIIGSVDFDTLRDKPTLVSGSSQITISDTTGYSTFSSSIATTDLNQSNRLTSIEDKTGSYATTGSNLFKGTQTHSGSILPSVDNTYDLGSVEYQWRDVYISSGSLYIDGTKVISSTAQELVITTDNGQSIKILEGTTDSIILQTADGDIELKSSADGDILLDPTNGKILLKGPIEVLSGQKIQSSVGGTPVVFAGDIVVSGSIDITGTIEGINLTDFSSSVNGRLGSVEGGVTSLNSFTSSASGRLSSLETESGSVRTTLNSYTSSNNGRIDLIETSTGSLNTFTSSVGGRVTSLESKTGSYATTGSNIFVGSQTISGSVIIRENLTVLGSSSITYTTSSQLRVDDNVIVVNTSNPAERFGGLQVYDSGSVGDATGSLFWDSQKNRWVYQNSSEASYGGGVLLSGPRSSGSLGDELTLTSGKIARSAGGDHLNDSIITEYNGTTIGINGGLEITGSIISTVTPLVSGSGQISFTGITDKPTLVSGSSQISFNTITDKPTLVSGSSQILNGSGIWSGSAQLPSGIISGSSQLPSGVVSGSSQIDLTATTNYSTGIKTRLNAEGVISGSSQVLSGTGIWSGSAQLPSGIISGSSQLPSGVVSGSSQVDLTATTNYSSGIKTRLNAEGVISGSSQILNGSGVWSGSAQLPSGVVSGSVQVLNGSGVWSGSAQLPSGVVSGSSQVTLSSTTGYGSVLNQAVLTTSTPTFAELRVNGVIESPYLGYKPIVFYDFNSDTTGDWGKANATLSTPSKSITRYTSTGVDSNINRSFNFTGGENQIIRIHYKVISGTPGGGQIFYSNSQHSYSGSYYKALNLINDGNWHTLVLDMSDLSSGGTDWIDFDVTAIRFDLTDTSGVVIDIDWISIGGNGYGTQYFEDDVAFMNGSVGFGTTAPTTGKVVIRQTGGTQLNLISDDSSGSTDVLLKLTSGIDYRGRGIWMENSATTGAWYAGVPYTGGAYSIGYSSTAPEYVANSKFFINTSGNIGINTTSLSSKFTVYKGSQSNTVSIANSAAFIYGADIGLAIGQDSGAAGYGTWLQSMQTGGSSFPMTINPNGGNVIVGSLTTSSYKFSVFGGQYGTYLRGGDLGTGSDILRLVDSAGNTKYLARGDGKHYFDGDTEVNGGDFKFNPGTGNLGNRYLYINKGASNDGGILMSRDNTLDWQIINSTSTGNLSFYSYGTGTNTMVINRGTREVTIGGNLALNNSGIGWIYGNDTNHSIIMRGDRNGTAADYTNYYQYGGTIASGKGHKFWTGGVLASQTLRFHIGDDYTYNTGNMTIGGTLTENSSLRYKKDIVTIENGLDKVLRMRGVTYLKKENDIKEVGVIAEEIGEILPDLVKYNTEGQIDSVSYGRITAVLIEAIKELKQEINDLKNNG